MIYVDTGYLLAVLSPGDELFERAQRWATTLNERLLTTEYVLLELVNALSDPADRPKVHAAVAEIRSSENGEVVEGSRELFSAGLSLHEQRTDKHWSLTDCASFIVMQRHDVSRALAHDHHFEEAGFEALLRREP